ncbi:protein misato homolog 1 [Phalaenopsis equestris]|uniref:protein misato homolog 1 n=1 Tax=Phalaenopsis equestris TaxID=78828 RepID=UPI0009E2E41C|nr:protein misato homolog 1 [Phalaenopsis equestris]XP_020579109.1 protein misato homolog 1 [Phalaenopsis equestris]XP_020579110.1 protein misato homolog 1 [Phalaenopsis equestris]
MREIVTIQVGEFANYIGSHYWNFQDELLGLAEERLVDSIYMGSSLDMDVLYRSGETSQGIVTYCPRLLSVGYKGTLGSLSSSGSLSPRISLPDTSEIVTWAGNVTQYLAEPREKNFFLQSLSEEDDSNLNPSATDLEGSHFHRQLTDKDRIGCLENGVQYWTDFSKVNYHPHSLYELHGLWNDVEKFDNYGIGEDILSAGFQSEEMNERLRFFIEECDQIQGIQFIVDDTGSFSAIAAGFLEDIADEYSNTPVLLYSARSPSSYKLGKSLKDSVARALHDAVSFSRLSSCCKLMVPVGLPFLSRSKLSSTLFIEDQNLFHSSAIYAASIHSISIPFRMESLGVNSESLNISGATDMGGMVQFLAGQARQNMITILDLAMPAQSLNGENNQSTILRSLCSLTPEIEESIDDLHSIESLIIHGVLSGGRRASVSEVEEYIHTEYQNELQRPMFYHLTAASCPLPIPLPFPSIFNNRVGRQGELSNATLQEAERRGSLEVDSVPMAARLRSSSAVKPFIERRLGSLRRYGLERGALGVELLRSWGFGKEEVEDMGETLCKMMMLLDPNAYAASSEFDSD